MARLMTVLLSMIMCLTSLPALAALGVPKSELWARWQTHARAATLQVDDAPWAAFLATYRRIDADGVARIAYGAVTPADRARLSAYVKSLQSADVDLLTRPQQFAYWVNFYNAATVDIVVRAYPVKSIRAIEGGLLGLGPWGRKRFTVKGEELSLNDIEHRILRPIWRDARVHYAVNCASIGCPNLAAEPWRADRVEPMLDAAARSYINSPRGFKREKGRLIASRIYQWFGVDWGDEAAILAHARLYATPTTRAALGNATRIDGYHYDWELNDAPHR
jgi:Protein of unknown function, DUF547